MAILSGLSTLVTNVQAYFTAHSVAAEVRLGSQERDWQLNQSVGGAGRVTFAPGDSGGRGGTLSRDIRGPGGNPRPIFNWAQIAMVSVWAVDGAQIDSDAAQIVAAEALFEQTMRAIQYSAKADVKGADVLWTPRGELNFGREIMLTLHFDGPLYDAANGVANLTNKALTRTFIPQ